MVTCIKLLREGAVVPARATEGSACHDLVACWDADFIQADQVLMFPHTRALVPTGIALAIPHGYEAQIRPRSGLAAKHGITVLNAPGTIDSDYRGEVKVCLINHSSDTFVLSKGDRIAQLSFHRVEDVALLQVQELDGTARGEGGFGSTGK